MASLSMGESRWRMLRRGLKKKKFRYEDARNMSRNDQMHFDWLLSAGFFKEAGDGYYTVTDRGREAADLGFYEV
jgi:hypothetical protein